MKIISSKDNSIIKKFRSLSVKKYREQFGLYVIEGEKVVKEALNIHGLVENLIILDTKQDDYKDLIENHEDKVILVTKPVFESLSFEVSPQFIMAIVKTKPKLNKLPHRNMVVLDKLQDPGNLGTIIRSAVASGINDIVLIDSVDPYNDKTVRSASGTIFYPNFYKLTEEEFIEDSSKNGISIVVAEAGKKSIFDPSLSVKSPYALVIGNEGQGVGQKILDQKHISISIPMDSRVESLNASVSASVLMFILTNK